MTARPVTELLETFVPHRGAMLLIDCLLEASAEYAVAEVKVPAEGLFARDGGVPSWVGIEYMAQTIAAWAGARHQSQGEKSKIGFLLGSRRYEVRRPVFAAGSLLRVEVRCEMIGQNGLGAFDCRILCAGEEWARARVTVFEPADQDSLLDQLQKKTTNA